MEIPPITINAKTALSTTIVLVLIGIAANYSTQVSNVDQLLKRVDAIEKTVESDKNILNDTQNRTTKLETQYNQILSDLLEIKNSIRDITPKK